MDLKMLRANLGEGRGYWRGLEEASGSPAFVEALGNEFPDAASEWNDHFSRRNFLKVMGASVALAGLTGCVRPTEEKILPYVQQPEGLTPGKPLFYASAMPFCGYAKGVVVEQHEGRPTKIEGNPDHPASLGASDVFMQASILGMYDPDRSQFITHSNAVSSWPTFTSTMLAEVDGFKANQGQGFRILTGAVSSPTLAAQIADLKKTLPKMQWHQYEPVGRDNIRAGTAAAFGKPLNVVYDFSKAQIIVALDSNFLIDEPASLVYARQFADGRRLPVKDFTNGNNPFATAKLNRLYVAESTPSVTGSVAEHRLPIKASQIGAIAAAIAAGLGINVGGAATQPSATAGIAAATQDATQGAAQAVSASVAAAVGATTQPAVASAMAATQGSIAAATQDASAATQAMASATTQPNSVGSPLSDAANQWVAAVVADLTANKGAAVIVVGENQPAEIHALVHALNDKLGNLGAGKPVSFTDPIEASLPDAGGVGGIDSLKALVADMSAGNVDTLLIIGGNPAFNAPPDLNFADAMSKVRLRIRLGSHADETSLLCHWQLPESHYLEAWGDARAFDGTVSIIQPLIAPLYDSKSAIEVLSILGGTLDKTGYEIVRAYWAAQKPSSDFDIQWQKWVEKGVVPGTALPAVSVSAKVPSTLSTVVDTAGVTEIAFRQDPHIFDGSWANNGWLQELPKPVSKIVWDNVALMSVATAEKLQVWNNDVVKITVGGTAIELPVWVQAGQPDDQITVHLGYGRTAGGRVANGVGVNVYRIRTSDKLWSAPVDAIEKTDKTYTICAVHTHHSIQSRSLPYTDLEAEVIKRAVVDGPDSEKPPQRLIDNRNLVRVATIAQLAKDPEAIRELEPDHEERQALRDQGKKVTLSLYQDYDDLYKQNYQWGMSIDMQTCIGCNACVIACQAENNITVVGKEQVSVGREMHWIRIDTYYGGELDNPEMYHQPLPCMHCENAPCEYVCPVEATVHDNEGVNDMVYNRCVGTRYCSNNCPYKVRRFNFFQYVDYTTESLKLQRNPEVTVRVRGVMEKCTYCIQRINETRYAIEKTQVQQEELANKATADGSPDVAADILAKMKITQQVLLDGLQTACQQACPTEAIVFGNINVDKEPAGDGRVSKVKQLKDSPLDYGLLTELTTRPRTTYLPRVTNPSDAMQKGSA